MNKPELLAPAGGREALIAAVQNGADAVYLGAGNFNARQTADNFDGDALSEAIAYAHERGVRVHVTLNTVVRQDELSDLADSIRAIAAAGADAVLVQDFGVARMVKQIAPQLAIHASTQMAVHNRSSVEFLARQGFDRVVLAREMDLESVRDCAKVGIEVEVFVHGALCVACSGQCLFSSMVGGRSGNRGRCAQPCRLPYRMDGAEGCLLSTKDLCALDQLDALREAGVASLKIEGRLKRPEYVAAVVSAYRAALDSPEAPRDPMPLKQMFHRGGFTQGYLPGVSDTELMYAPRPNHLGVPVGRCIRDGQLLLEADIDPADALVLRRDEQTADRPVKCFGRAGETVSAPCRRGEALIRLVSECQMQSARASFADERRVVPLTASLKLRVGQPSKLTVSDGAHTVCVLGDEIAKAQSRGADARRVESQLRKTGGTAYTFADIALDMDADAFCPVSALNALRRDALDALRRARLPRPYALHEPVPPKEIASETSAVPAVLAQSGDASLLRIAAESGADGVVFAPTDIREAALEKAAAILPEKFRLALPPVIPQHSLEALHGWAQRHADRIEATYLSNIGHFAFGWFGTILADYGLNAANRYAQAQLRDWGCAAVTPSVELTAGQIADLDGARELIVHGRIPLMHLRHCPYRAVHHLNGRHTDCRRCDVCAADDTIQRRALTDRTGAQFPLRRFATDEGCVIDVLNSVPLMLLKRIGRLPKANAWRLLIDDADDLPALRLYRLAARGEDFRADPAWEKYESMNTTTGHYFRGVE